MKEPKNLSKQPGLYLFKNADKEIIYIGKAKNIAKRVASYFTKQVDDKTSLLLDEATSIDTISTQSEIEALHLEAQLIKQYQPKFNILLKEGNPFIFLFISQAKVPTLSVTRKKEKKGTYFGPFISKKHAHSVYNFLLKTFRLKLCNKKIEHGCLEYHIGICAGNCTPNFDLEFYKFTLELAKQLLKSNGKQALQLLDEQIKVATQNLQFEKAQQLHTYKHDIEVIINTLKKLSSMPSKQTKQSIDKNLPLLIKVKQRLKLTHIPYVIDCFDISHMQGQTIVGSCIRYVHGVPEKKSFRKFSIKTIADQDDYAALREIVQRRYKNHNQEPNLVIVDGGKGQINAIKPFIHHAELVGLAKREETIFSSNLKELIKLDSHRPEDILLLQIRDYAHHFAISYHRTKRTVIQ